MTVRFVHNPGMIRIYPGRSGQSMGFATWIIEGRWVVFFRGRFVGDVASVHEAKELLRAADCEREVLTSP